MISESGAQGWTVLGSERPSEENEEIHMQRRGNSKGEKVESDASREGESEKG